MVPSAQERFLGSWGIRCLTFLPDRPILGGLCRECGKMRIIALVRLPCGRVGSRFLGQVKRTDDWVITRFIRGDFKLHLLAHGRVSRPLGHRRPVCNCE